MLSRRCRTRFHSSPVSVTPFGAIRSGAFALVLPVLACSGGNAPPTSESSPLPGSYAEAQERLRLRNQQVAEAFEAEMGDRLPTAATDVIARHLEAVGGQEAFDSIRTMVLRFTANGTSGSLGEMVRYYKKPLLYRQEMVGSGRATVTDGSRVWQVGPDGWDEAEGDDSYLAFASMDNHFVDPELGGIGYELMGVMALDADPGYLVRRTWPHGAREDLFFSAVSGLLTGRRTDYHLMPESWFSYWDYRDFGGVRLPTVHIRSIGDLGPPHGLVLQNVQVNVPLSDSLFVPPDGEG